MDQDLRPRLVSIAQAADMLGVGRTKLYELLDSGELRAVQIGVRRLVTIASIDGLIERALEADQAA